MRLDYARDVAFGFENDLEGAAIKRNDVTREVGLEDGFDILILVSSVFLVCHRDGVTRVMAY